MGEGGYIDTGLNIVGNAPNVKTIDLLESDLDGFPMPDIGDAGNAGATPAVITFELHVNDEVSKAPISVTLLYSCDDERRQEEFEFTQFAKRRCVELKEELTVLTDAEKLKSHLFVESRQCLNARLYYIHRLQADYDYFCRLSGDIELPDWDGMFDALFKTIYDRNCVSAPCGDGGFCSKKSVCETSETNGYTFFDEETMCGDDKDVGCCEPPCTVSFINSNLINPGQCRQLEQDQGRPFAYGQDMNGRVQLNDQICYPLDYTTFYDAGVRGRSCSNSATHCCVAIGCVAKGNDPLRGDLSGVCKSRETCSSKTVSGRCNDPSAGVLCCEGLNGVQLDSHNAHQPRVNKETENKRPEFRENVETTLPGSAQTIVQSLMLVLAVL